MGERRGTKALELWCRRMTDGYPGVRVDNMTTSWRDGLAFCAMIHHFRPDLIDFSSLNKDDVYGNNDLAFRVAEQHLGIPALLDAEDMVSCPVPDRLSILTYLSQFYQTFAGSSQVGSPTRIIPKRPSGVTECGMVSPSSSSPPTKISVLQHNHIGGMSRREPCAKCKLPVFIAERLHVGKQLYHRTCFKCARCSHQLSLADYYETEEGKYCCETCPDEDISIYSDAKDSVKQKSLSDEEKELKIKSIDDDDDYNTAFENTFEQDEALIARRTEARSSFFSKQLFPEDESVSSVSSISEKLENKTEVDMSFKDDLDEPPELPSSKPPDINLPTAFELEVSSDIDCVVLNEQSANESSSVDVLLCSDTSVQPSVTDIVAPFSISDDSTNKNVTKDTEGNGISIVKARMLLFETNAKPYVTSFDEEHLKKSHIEDANSVVSEISTQEVPSVEIIAQSECDLRSDDINNIDDSYKLDIVTSTNEVENADFINITVSSDSQENYDSPVLQINSPIVLLKSVLENLSDASSDFTINSSILNESVVKSETNYPVDLNPFGEDEEDNVEVEIKPKKESTNPFGSSDEEEDEIKKEEKPLPTPRSSRQNQSVKKVIPAPRVSLNPFWSDGEEPSDEDINSPPVPKPRTSKTLHLTPEPSPKPRKMFNNSSHYSSASSLSSLNSTPSGTTRKKKPAPKPPISKDFLNATPGHTLRKTRPAPAPPTSTPFETVKVVMDAPVSPISSRTNPIQNAISKENIIETQSESSPSICNEWEKEKMGKDETNRNRQSMTSDSVNVNSPNSETNLPAPNKSTFGKWKRKKGQAPARPVPQRRQIKALPIVELRSELESIEIQQQGLEKQGVKLEQIIREKCEGPGVEEDFTMTIEVEDLVLQLFELVNEKNELFRKQAELMYLRRQQRLEEEHADLEYQIRCLMSQPESNKTDSDKAHEEELINRLVEVVERRNEIVQCLEMDRIREAEEDFSISTQMTLLALKREEENQEKESPPVKLSKKEKKKIKKERKGKGDSKLDADKDVDESETSMTSVKEKKKKKWFLHK